MPFFLFYTDPGSGMMLLQLLLASLVGAFYYFRNFFFGLLGRKTNSPNPDASADATETGDSSNTAK